MAVLYCAGDDDCLLAQDKHNSSFLSFPASQGFLTSTPRGHRGGRPLVRDDPTPSHLHHQTPLPAGQFSVVGIQARTFPLFRNLLLIPHRSNSCPVQAALGDTPRGTPQSDPSSSSNLPLTTPPGALSQTQQSSPAFNAPQSASFSFSHQLSLTKVTTPCLKYYPLLPWSSLAHAPSLSLSSFFHSPL